MPWALDDQKKLILTAMPTVQHLNKYGWENIGMITLSNKVPHAVVMDERIQWWKHIPLADGQVKDLTAIWLARDTAIAMLNEELTVIIHCMAGRNRSGLIGALVLQQLDNLTGPEALARVRQQRPRSVDNIHFETFLMSLGRPR